MSVAFTREEDLEATAADLPDRPISPHPNLVTAAGLAAIEDAARSNEPASLTAHVAELRDAHAAALRELAAMLSTTSEASNAA